MADEAVVVIPEKFDFAYHQKFTASYQKLLDSKAPKITLDFSRTQYLDSSALGMMVLLHKKAKADNIITVVRGAKGTAKAILAIAKIEKLYRIE